MTETEFIVYRWEDETLVFERRLFVRLVDGLPVLPQHVRAAMESEVGAYPAGQYRAVPVTAYVDLTVTSTVTLP